MVITILLVRFCDQMVLYFSFNDQIFLHYLLICVLNVAPWYFTKALTHVVAHLRNRDHRVYVYIEDIFGSPQPSYAPHETSADVLCIKNEIESLSQ